MFKRAIVIVGAAAMLVGCSNSNMKASNGVESNNLTAQDNNFLRYMSEANMLEIQEATAAKDTSNNPAIKTFAQKMISDHTMAQNELSQLASSKGAQLPTQLEPAQMEMVSNLQNKTGTDFDKQYVSDQIAAHQQAITMDKHETTEGNDQDVKDMAMQLLPKLQMHLQLAEQLQNNMNAGTPDKPLDMNMNGGTNMTGNSQGT